MVGGIYEKKTGLFITFRLQKREKNMLLTNKKDLNHHMSLIYFAVSWVHSGHHITITQKRPANKEKGYIFVACHF